MSSSPGSPSTVRGVSADPARDYSHEVEALRATHRVRALTPNEEGSAVAALPGGVYGFTYAPGQPEVPLFSKQNYHSFEVHKSVDGTEYILGFVTQLEAADLNGPKGGAAIRLFPSPWESSQTLVSVPVAGIVAPKRMPREDGNPLPFTLV